MSLGKFELLLSQKKKGEAFGTSFVIQSDDQAYKSKYTAKCTSECHLMCFSKKNLARIKDRIFKKQMLNDLKFMREVHQLRSLNKRVLVRLWNHMKVRQFKRN